MNFFEEFDPGSERTLAAWLRHASRTVCCSNMTYSGGRVSNEWVMYPGHRNSVGTRKGSFAKVTVIPDDTFGRMLLKLKGWGPSGLSAWDQPISYQLVGEVTAHQGNDG